MRVSISQGALIAPVIQGASKDTYAALPDGQLTEILLIEARLA